MKRIKKFWYLNYQFVPMRTKTQPRLKDCGAKFLTRDEDGYSWDGFYKAAARAEAQQKDYFKCVQTGKVYIPCNAALFEIYPEYAEELQLKH